MSYKDYFDRQLCNTVYFFITKKSYYFQPLVPPLKTLFSLVMNSSVPWYLHEFHLQYRFCSAASYLKSASLHFSFRK